MKLNCNQLIQYYTANKTSKEFRCHEKDLDAPNLKFENTKLAEKNYKLQETIHGAIGMAATNMLVVLKECLDS